MASKPLGGSWKSALPIVMLTAHGDEDLVALASASASRYLVKPFREQDLLPHPHRARAPLRLASSRRANNPKIDIFIPAAGGRVLAAYGGQRRGRQYDVSLGISGGPGAR